MCIDSFSGEFHFLSNFYASAITFAGITYPTVEHAYQAAKSTDNNIRIQIAYAATPGIAKKMGRAIFLRHDWETVKIPVMESLLRAKFQYPFLRKLLLDTGDKKLIEGNYWGDKFWGVCNGAGENNLGKLLMKIRDEARS